MNTMKWLKDNLYNRKVEVVDKTGYRRPAVIKRIRVEVEVQNPAWNREKMSLVDFKYLMDASQEL